MHSDVIMGRAPSAVEHDIMASWDSVFPCCGQTDRRQQTCIASNGSISLVSDGTKTQPIEIVFSVLTDDLISNVMWQTSACITSVAKKKKKKKIIITEPVPNITILTNTCMRCYWIETDHCGEGMGGSCCLWHKKLGSEPRIIQLGVDAVCVRACTYTQQNHASSHYF